MEEINPEIEIAAFMHGPEAKETNLAINREQTEAFQWLADKTNLYPWQIALVYKSVSDYSKLDAWSSYRKIIKYDRDGKRRVCWNPRNPLLKLTQEKISNNVLSKIPRHPNNIGFSGGRLEEAIIPHLKSEMLLSMDIKKAFHSTKKPEVLESLKRCPLTRIPPGVPEIIAQICTFPVGQDGDLVIPQGTSSSPRLFDETMRPVDNELAEIVKGTEIKYTRYADNLFFSGDFGILQLLKKTIINVVSCAGRGNAYKGYYRLHKIRFRDLSKPYSARILGLNINHGQMFNTPRTKKRFRAVIFYLRRTLEQGDNPTHLLNVFNGLKGWIRLDTLTPSIRRDYEQLLEILEKYKTSI